MNIWICNDNKYVMEAAASLDKAKRDLSVAKLDLLRLENDMATINYHLNLIINNVRTLRKSAIIINIEEFRKIQRESFDLRNKRAYGISMTKVIIKTIKQIEEKIAVLIVALEKLHNNILEMPSENKRS